MKMVVTFDNQDDSHDEPVELTEEMVTLRHANGTDIPPVSVEHGHVATYDIEEDREHVFWEALEAASWCYTGAERDPDGDLSP